MRKPTDELITRLSKTKEGAKAAAVLKWEWLVQAPTRSVIKYTEDDREWYDWPVCGLCCFYNKCKLCPLKSCKRESGLYSKAAKAAKRIDWGFATLTEFRAAAQKMLDKIKSL